MPYKSLSEVKDLILNLLHSSYQNVCSGWGESKIKIYRLQIHVKLFLFLTNLMNCGVLFYYKKKII